MRKIILLLLMFLVSPGFLQAQLKQIELPVDFEDSAMDYTLSDFGDNITTLGEDPNDTTNTVAISIKTTGAATWAGTTIGTDLGFASAIPFTATATKLKVRVYSPTAGIQVRLKAEDHTDVTLTAETEATTSIANAWEELIFDFSNVAAGTNPFNLNTNFDKLSIFFNFGVEGANKTYYWDDIIFLEAAPADDATLYSLLIEGSPVPNFSSAILDYTFELPYGTTEVPAITAASNNPLAVVVINAAATLSDTTTIVVTSEDSSTELTYTVAFTLSTTPSNDTTLKDLLVNGSSVAGFSPSLYSYIIQIPDGTGSVPPVTAISSHHGANIVVNAAAALSDTTRVIVTAQDNSTVLTYTISFTIISLQSLPIDFEQGPYDFQDFDGGTATVIDNPQSSGINTSATVAQIVRNGGAIWAGSKLILNSKIDFSINNTFSMKVYSTRANIPVLFKLEGSNAATEVSVNTSLANEWETLTWDFAGTASNTYNEIVFMFDFGSVGDSSANSTFLFDDIELYDITGGLAQIDLPVSFDNPSVYYGLTDFDGASTILGPSPTDPANTVAITTRESGSAPWAGTTIGTDLGFATRIPFTESETKISVEVYSPLAGIPVLLKAEDHNDVTKTAETFSNTTVANAWETLTFDFSNVAPGTNPFNLSTYFDKVSIMFNKGNAGTGKTYYWDDVVFGGSVSTVRSFEENSNIQIYSDNGKIYVKCPEELINSQIEVFDLTGRKVHSSTIVSINEQINLYSRGILIVRITQTSIEGVITQKLIIR